MILFSRPRSLVFKRTGIHLKIRFLRLWISSSQPRKLPPDTTYRGSTLVGCVAWVVNFRYYITNTEIHNPIPTPHHLQEGTTSCQADYIKTYQWPISVPEHLDIFKDHQIQKSGNTGIPPLIHHIHSWRSRKHPWYGRCPTSVITPITMITIISFVNELLLKLEANDAVINCLNGVQIIQIQIQKKYPSIHQLYL